MPIGILMSTAKKNQNSIDWDGVGLRLKSIRGEQTQADFAQKIGVSQGYLSHLERGEKEIGPEILLRISAACGKTIEWLLTGKQ
jgi:transcriptional regulator with XRE-family HTH domain